MTVTPERETLLRDDIARIICRANVSVNYSWEGSTAWVSQAEALRLTDIILNRLASKPSDEVREAGLSCVLQNQIEIMGAVSLLLRYAKPDMIGNSGELDQQRDDLYQRHKATQVALSTTGETKP